MESQALREGRRGRARRWGDLSAPPQVRRSHRFTVNDQTGHQGSAAGQIVYGAATTGHVVRPMGRRDRHLAFVHALAAQERIIVVRNAERLTAEAAGQLQWLHLRPGKQFSLYLIGDTNVGAALHRDHLLYDDIATTVEIRPLVDTVLRLEIASRPPWCSRSGVCGRAVSGSGASSGGAWRCQRGDLVSGHVVDPAPPRLAGQ